MGDLWGLICPLSGLAVIALLFYSATSSSVSGRVEALEKQVAGLQAQLAALRNELAQSGAPPVLAAPASPVAVETSAPLTAVPATRAPSLGAAPAPVLHDFLLPPTPPPPAPSPALPAAPTTRSPALSPDTNRQASGVPAGLSLEERIGGQWLGWLGAITVAVTAALAIMWAYRQGWITPLLILSAGWLLGAGLLVASETFRRRLPLYGQGLAGAGIAVLYITTYAGHVAYGTLSASAATLGLIAEGILAIGMALRHDSPIIGWIGIVLAYASPVLLGGGSSPAPLFLYLTALNGVVLGISVTRHWVAFRGAAFAATAFLYAAWFVRSYTPLEMDAALLFVGVNWAIFLGVTALYPLLRDEATTDTDLGVAALNPIATALAFYTVLNERHTTTLALVAAVLASVYYAAARGIRARRRTEDYLEQLFFAAALVFGLLVVPFWLKARAMAAGWALMGAGLTAVGARTGSRRTRAWGAAGLALALGRLLARDVWLAPVAGAPAFFNERGFSFAVVLLGLTVVASASARDWTASGRKDTTSAGLLGLLALLVGGLLTLWIRLDAPSPWIAPLWCGVSALTLAFGWQLRCREVRLVGLLLGLPPLLAALSDPPGAGLFLLTGAGLLAVPTRLAVLALAAGAAWAYQRSPEITLDEAERGAAVPLGAAAAAAVAMTWSAAELGPGWLPVSWAVVALALLWAGWKTDRSSLRILAVCAAMALTVEGLAREVVLPPGRPWLLHSRSAAALAGIVTWAACARVFFRRSTPDERTAAAVFAVLANALALGWLSVEARDAALRLAGSGEAPGFALSAAWVVYAAGAIGLGFWKRLHAWRWGGMALLLAAVGKVYLVDMASLALGYRVLSFLVLALVLLGISYLYQRQGLSFWTSEGGPRCPPSE